MPGNYFLMNRRSRFQVLILWVVFLSAVSHHLYAQPASDSLNYPRMNRPCPDFTLHNIKYYPKKEAKLSDFRGKWLLLSFWNKYCGGCIASFPRENKWNEQYGDKMQFMSVAIQDKEGEIGSLFERYRKRENLSFPVAYDSSLANRWNIFAGPYFILIDPEGIVRDRVRMTSDLLDAFIQGKSPKVAPTFEYEFEKDTRAKTDEAKPFLVNDNGGIDSVFSFRSLISEYDCMSQRPSNSKEFISEKGTMEGYGNLENHSALHKGMVQFVGVPLQYLYSYAWLGARSPFWSNKLTPKSYLEKIRLQIKDSSLLKYLDCYNLFCYSLKLPESKSGKEKVMHIMRQDLENYFGFTASVEDSTVTVWKLVAANKERLRSKGGKPEQKSTTESEDYFVRNTPWSKWYQWVTGQQLSGLDITDSTGITGNVDIDMHCSFAVLDEVKKALHENGLELLPVKSVRKVLVIKDLKE